ncbi:MAG: hypothetical protein NUV56_02390, partial [Candidatus Uhrbacteria bacterium]|nr:hypothetical protein [Candidatus Uhrbacteria bacterium]
MPRMKFEVPKGDMSKEDKEAIAKKIGAEARAKAKAEEVAMTKDEYYGGDVLNTKEVSAEAKGKELIEKGRELDRKVGEWAEKKFAGFFGGLRDRASKMADHVAKAMSISLGKGAEAASVAG